MVKVEKNSTENSRAQWGGQDTTVYYGNKHKTIGRVGS